jgi:hypothetical protein
MRWTVAELAGRVAALTEPVKAEILCGVAWDLFGDLGEDGVTEYVDTDHRPDHEELAAAIGYLRVELERERSPVFEDGRDDIGGEDV